MLNLIHRTYSSEEPSRSNATLTLMKRCQWHIAKLYPLVRVSKVESVHSGYSRRTKAHTSILRTTRKLRRNLHLHITVNASVSPSFSAHTGNPGIHLGMVLLIVRSSVVTCLLEGRETHESKSEDDEDCHDHAERDSNFVTHLEVSRLDL